jgi:hypothetical protein
MIYSRLPVSGGCVIRILIPYVYNLSEALLPLSSIPNTAKKADHLYQLYSAHSALQNFLYQSVWSQSLRVCKGPGQKLLEAIDVIFADEHNEEIEFLQRFNLSQAISSFRIVLEAEFQTAATYLVTERRGYDIATLIERAEVIFPTDLTQKIPEVEFDLREAGKCIAFDLGTAAGFHLLRALETVICCYWNVVMNGSPLPDNRNLGAYIREMEKAKAGDGKVLTALKQIKDFHRNSLMHPEERLDLDQSIGLLGIVQSAIVAMLPKISDHSGLQLMEVQDAQENPVGKTDI